MSKKKKEKNEAEATEEGAVVATEGEDGAPKKGKKKLVFIAAAVLLLLGVGAGLFFSGVLGGDKKAEKQESHEGTDAKAAAEIVKPVYYELPEFLVNLTSTTSRVSFLKMSVTLELKDAASVAVLDANAPRVKDIFNTYLRELRPSDVQGSAGIFRLKTELMSRLNGTIEAGVVKDILFGEIIVQ